MAHRIAVPIFPDFQLLGTTGPVAAFEIISWYRDDHYALRMAVAQVGPARSPPRARWDAGTLPPASQADTLLIAGDDGVDAAMVDARARCLMQHCATRDACTTSMCSGSLLPVATGLLDGRRATIRWGRSEQFARTLPQVQPEPDRTYVNDDLIWTSADISVGIDLAFALIAGDLGERLARAVARQLVMYYRRSDGQSQFPALNEMDSAHGRFKPLLGHVWHNLGAPYRVGDLAEYVCMSPRHFVRTFQIETGFTPVGAVEKLCVGAACAVPESRAVSMQRVATERGFGDTERIRRSFQCLLGVPPFSLRAR